VGCGRESAPAAHAADDGVHRRPRGPQQPAPAAPQRVRPLHAHALYQGLTILHCPRQRKRFLWVTSGGFSEATNRLRLSRQVDECKPFSAQRTHFLRDTLRDFSDKKG